MQVSTSRGQKPWLKTQTSVACFCFAFEMFRRFQKSARSPSSAHLSFFGEGSPTKTDYRKKKRYPYSIFSTGGPRSADWLQRRRQVSPGRRPLQMDRGDAPLLHGTALGSLGSLGSGGLTWRGPEVAPKGARTLLAIA